jgi:nitric oxide reductase NorD protein
MTAALVNEAFILSMPDGPRAELQRIIDSLPPVTLKQWIASGALREWLQQSTTVTTARGGKSEEKLSQLIAAIPTILPQVEGNEIGDWVRAALDIAESYPAVFASLPPQLSRLELSERLNVYRLVRSAAYRSPEAAAVLYTELPGTVLQVPDELRSLLFRCLQSAASFDPSPLPNALPLIGPTLRTLPQESHYPLLERMARLAQTLPASVSRLFRTLTRAYDAVGADGIVDWIHTGEEIAQKNPQAGEAFFALESRTSQLFLSGSSVHVALSDIYGFILRYLHMLSGVSVELKEDASVVIPAPLADDDGEVIPLPALVDVFATYEENLRLYRALAAQHAGRLAFGTYDCSIERLWPTLPTVAHDALAGDGTVPTNLATFFARFPQPQHIEALFLLVEHERIAARLAATYQGLHEDLAWTKSIVDLHPPAVARMRRQLPQEVPLSLAPGATVYDSLLLATELYLTMTLAPGHEGERRFEDDFSEPSTPSPDQQMMQPDDNGGGVFVDPAQQSLQQRETWQKFLEALRERAKKSGKSGQKNNGPTIVVTHNVTGSQEETEGGRRGKSKRRGRPGGVAEFGYLYDEWDYLIDDYRPQWCELRERAISGDDGGFFSRALAAHEEIIAEVKREFQRLRPRQYRHVGGLEHGEEIDVNAAVAARVDLRSGISPSAKLYTARQPLERDVAALFLLDLSASTESAIPDGEGRVIDRMKEALVLLTTALEEIGDVYSVYGFSSYGRRNVEVFPVKSFNEPLTQAVKARIGGLTPQRSTRMGPAVRHATRKLRDLSCRAKFLVLLSDGYPEDADYGPSQHAPTYGVRDTMMALREAERNGILSFCLTIDKTGRDYLREMCSPSRYMIIEDVTSLPAELPKIYQRYIRAQSQ